MTDRTSAEQRDDPVEQLRARVRAAFDGEDVPRKNIALRISWDALRKLRTERDEARAALKELTSAVINDMIAEGQETEWSRNSAISAALRALGCKSQRLDETVLAALREDRQP